jgi:hypothetical protein
MACSCSIYACDDEYLAGFMQDKIVKARKVHHCSECSRVILPGEKYEHTKCVMDGEWSRHKTCLDCQSIRLSFFESYIFGQLWESFREYLCDCRGQVPESCIAKLTPAARAKVCELIEQNWDYL